MKNILNAVKTNAADVITITGMILAGWANYLAFFDLERRIWLILCLVSGAGLTDWIDGWIARKFGTQSQAGAFLDRLRDKILICPFLILILQQPLKFPESLTPSLLNILIYFMLGAELILIVGAAIGIIKGLNVASSKYGKQKMFGEFFVVAIWMSTWWLQKHTTNGLVYLPAYLVVLLLFPTVIWGYQSIGGYLERYLKKSQE